MDPPGGQGTQVHAQFCSTVVIVLIITLGHHALVRAGSGQGAQAHDEISTTAIIAVIITATCFILVIALAQFLSSSGLGDGPVLLELGRGAGHTGAQ